MAKTHPSPPRVTSTLLTELNDTNSPIQHGFFSRMGGVSKGCYSSLNVGLGSNDQRDHVLKNRALCEQALHSAEDSLHTLYQVHSNRVVVLDSNTPSLKGSPPEADALVTNRPGVMIGVLAADCMPFLFVDPVKNIIGAAHAGWRGALGGILEDTVNSMVALGSDPSDIHACLGPSLRQPSFEVGLDLVEQFIQKHPYSDRFFKPGISDEKRQFDLAGFGFWRLQTSGLEKLDDVNICTLARPDEYFSYRHAQKTQAPDYGRNLSAIVMEHS